jgi:hypothetical protein
MTSALSSLQRRLAGIALIAFVALLYTQDAIDPTDGVENTERIAMTAENSGRLFAPTPLFLPSFFMRWRAAAVWSGNVTSRTSLGHVWATAHRLTPK